jgi:hypothetical protein
MRRAPRQAPKADELCHRGWHFLIGLRHAYKGHLPSQQRASNVYFSSSGGDAGPILERGGDKVEAHQHGAELQTAVETRRCPGHSPGPTGGPHSRGSVPGEAPWPLRRMAEPYDLCVRTGHRALACPHPRHRSAARIKCNGEAKDDRLWPSINSWLRRQGFVLYSTPPACALGGVRLRRNWASRLAASYAGRCSPATLTRSSGRRCYHWEAGTTVFAVDSIAPVATMLLNSGVPKTRMRPISRNTRRFISRDRRLTGA